MNAFAFDTNCAVQLLGFGNDTMYGNVALPFGLLVPSYWQVRVHTRCWKNVYTQMWDESNVVNSGTR